MGTFIKRTKTSIGFGTSEIESEEDAYVNACVNSLSNDTKEVFIRRRQETRPWMPTPNMLHICGVGCLWYHDKCITETRSDVTILVAQTGASVFTYLSELFGDRLSYSDINCTFREELNMFFNNISQDFVPIEDYPIIQIQKEAVNFNPTSVYQTSVGILIGCVDDFIGVKQLGMEEYYITQINEKNEQFDAITRILYRIGYVLGEGGIKELNEIAYT